MADGLRIALLLLQRVLQVLLGRDLGPVFVLHLETEVPEHPEQGRH